MFAGFLALIFANLINLLDIIAKVRRQIAEFKENNVVPTKFEIF